MPKKNTHQTKDRIISAAWKLFYDIGYEETTIEDIIQASQTSRGTFYHYFTGKDALLGTLAYVFDEKYKELEPLLTEDMSVKDKLIFLNHELFTKVEDGISRELLSRLLATQLSNQSQKQLLDRDRFYFRMIRSIIRDGLRDNLFREDLRENDILQAYTMWERALLYDWCLASGEYSLVRFADRMTPVFVASLFRE
ncbi:MAG: TetR/AcrR family transcriptional regulator [Lachnospiraceae bacterium]|nr:TetR/AcrR family transcriptional regulator [Lachnospiraceae bacterium]